MDYLDKSFFSVNSTNNLLSSPSGFVHFPTTSSNAQGNSGRLAIEKSQANSQDALTCPHCHKTFCSRGNLNRHLRQVHDSNARKFKCTHPGCTRSFTRNTDLQVHMRIHSGEKPYECKIDNCGKRFARQSDLKVHERTHGESRKIECTWVGCGRKFHRMYDLKLHYAKVHLPHHHQHHYQNHLNSSLMKIQPPDAPQHRKRKLHHPDCVYHDQSAISQTMAKRQIVPNLQTNTGLDLKDIHIQAYIEQNGLGRILKQDFPTLQDSNETNKMGMGELSTADLQSIFSSSFAPHSSSPNPSPSSISIDASTLIPESGLKGTKPYKRCQKGHDSLTSIEFVDSDLYKKEYDNHFAVVDGDSNRKDSNVEVNCLEQIPKPHKRSTLEQENFNITNPTVGIVAHKDSDTPLEQLLRKRPRLSECSDEDCFKVFHNNHIDHLVNGRLVHYEKIGSKKGKTQFSADESNEKEKPVDCGTLKFLTSSSLLNTVKYTSDVNQVDSTMGTNLSSKENPSTPDSAHEDLIQSKKEIPMIIKEKKSKINGENQAQIKKRDQLLRRSSLPQLLTLPCDKCDGPIDLLSNKPHRKRTVSSASIEDESKVKISGIPDQSVSCSCDVNQFTLGLDLDIVDNDKIYCDKLCDLCLQFQDNAEDIEGTEAKGKGDLPGICDDTDYSHVHHHLVLHGDHIDTLDSMGFLHCSRLEGEDE